MDMGAEEMDIVDSKRSVLCVFSFRCSPGLVWWASLQLHFSCLSSQLLQASFEVI